MRNSVILCLNDQNEGQMDVLLIIVYIIIMVDRMTTGKTNVRAVSRAVKRNSDE